MDLFGENSTGIAFAFMVAVAVGGLIIAVILPLLPGSKAETRAKAIATGKDAGSRFSGLRARISEESKDGRRKQIQDSIKQLEDKEKERKKRVNLRTMIAQAGFEFSTRTFWTGSAICGVLFAAIPPLLGLTPWIGLGTAFIGFLGFPRWLLGHFRKRRQAKFINDFADAIDVMVRGLKAGLPVSEAMKIIASESGDPVGPEFMEVVDGQKVGISIDQGIERMVERIPLSEVNFLAIVMAIQAKTGGNLSEALSNLSRVLRDRKKMKAKVQAVSQEAKASASIIGSLPILMIFAVWFLNPGYLDPLFTTQIGNIVLFVSAFWMTLGVLIMRKMIQFEI